MSKNLRLGGILIASLLLATCNGDSEDRIQDVDVFLARVCELAAQCPGVSATQQEIDACPSGIRSGLSGGQLAELERFTTYSSSQQDCILACMGGAICGRFGGSLSNISDSDVLEPFTACELQCPAAGLIVALRDDNDAAAETQRLAGPCPLFR